MTSRLRTAVAMTAKETARNRTACVLGFVLPLLFYGLTVLTTSERIVVFELGSVSLEPDIEVPARTEGLVFMSLIAIGFMSAFFGVNLIQQHGGTNRRLVFCGYRPYELVLAKLVVLAVSVGILALVLPCAVLSILRATSPSDRVHRPRARRLCVRLLRSPDWGRLAP